MIELRRSTREEVNAYKNKSWSLSDITEMFGNQYSLERSRIDSIIQPILRPLGHSHSTLLNGHVLKGNEMPNLLLNYSLEYYQKAVYNFVAHYKLAKDGLYTWANVTNYYSNFFAINGLLALQGRVFTRINFSGTKENACFVHPLSVEEQEYLITTADTKGRSHQTPWRKYYNIYDSFQSINEHFDTVQLKRFLNDDYEESNYRNKINYKMYEGYEEPYEHSKFSSFKIMYNRMIAEPVIGKELEEYLRTLRALTTDVNFMYFARAALRIFFLAHLLENLALANQELRTQIDELKINFKNSIFEMYTPPNNYFEGIIDLL